MGIEVRIRPADSGWISANRGHLEQKIRALPSFVEERAPGEFWLKGAASTSTWPYDIRLFLEPEAVFVEISSKGEALFRDVAALYAELAREVPLHIEDADDPHEIVDEERLFRAPTG